MFGAPPGVADVLRSGMSGVEAVARMSKKAALVRRTAEAEGVEVDELRFADPALFDVFTLVRVWAPDGWRAIYGHTR